MPGANELEREGEVVSQVWACWLLKFDIPLRNYGTSPNINRNLDINLEKLTQKLTNNEWATNLQVIGPYRCKCRHVLVPAHGHPCHPQVRGCAAPCAVVEEPNGE